MSQYSKYNPTGAQIPPVPFSQPKGLYRFGEQTIWSSAYFAGAATLASTSNRLFSVAQGGIGQGFTQALSIAETNLKEAGRVPNGVAYDVFGISCQVLHCDNAADTGDFDVPVDNQTLIADLVNIINNGVLRWSFTQTTIDIAPVCLVGAGGGAFGAVAQNAAGANSGNMNNGNGHIWMYRKHPVALPGSTTFTVLLDFGSRAAPVSATGLAVRTTLLGYYKNIIEIG